MTNKTPKPPPNDTQIKMKNTLASRLKNLRESKGISHEKLASILRDNYNIRMSALSLKNYELEYNMVANKKRSEAGLGMNITYLYALSDFFGVSADYLLGLSDAPTSNKDIKAICEYTGLSESAVESLRYHKSNKDKIPYVHDLMDFFFDEFLSVGIKFKVEYMKSLKEWKVINQEVFKDIGDRTVKGDKVKLAQTILKHPKYHELTEREAMRKFCLFKLVETFKERIEKFGEMMIAEEATNASKN